MTREGEGERESATTTTLAVRAHVTAFLKCPSSRHDVTTNLLLSRITIPDLLLACLGTIKLDENGLLKLEYPRFSCRAISFCRQHA